MLRTLIARGAVALAASAALSPAPSALAQWQPPEPVGDAVDSLLLAAVGAGRVAGAVVVVGRGERIVLGRAYGLADAENDVPMTPEHLFPIASVTKQFTAAAVLKLVEQGRVGLDEPITRYLPDAPVGGRHVTVRQLLAHTSGMPDVTEAPGFRAVERLDLAPDSTLALVRDEPFHFAPGEQMRYSNSGYLLLGRLIEEVGGQPYGEFLAEHLFRPAGLRSARYCDQRALVRHRAHGYDYTPQGLVPARFVSLRIPFSAGGVCSTAADLAAWSRALHGGRILGGDAHAEMVRAGVLASGRSTRYGLGLALGTLAGRPAFHHGGDIAGFASYSAYFPEDSLSVTVLLNTQGPERPDALAARVAEAVLGPAALPAAPPAPADLGRFAGEYGQGVRVTVAAHGLRVDGAPSGPADLRFVGGTTFTDGRALYTFEGPSLWADLTWALVRWDRRR